MKKVSDYQWPSNFPIKSHFKKNKLNNNCNLIKKKIEKFFTEKIGHKALLFPSARSCIGAVIEFHNLGRNNEVYLNKWVSGCLFSSVGLYTNPTINFKKPDILIFNNLWGVHQKIFKKINFGKKTKLIDDSCDTIILNKNSAFPNKSDYEIFSLPKIIGSISGGIIISKNQKFLDFCLKRQKKNKEFGILQSKLKFLYNSKKTKYDFRYNEAQNSYTEINSLIDIFNKLKNYELNKSLAIKRSQILKKIVKFEKDLDRIGPAIAIDKNKFKKKNTLDKYFIFRHKLFNYKNNYSKKFLIFPIHFKIHNKRFNSLIKKLRENLK